MSDSPAHPPGLEENESFQRREWLALRIAFFVYAGILIAALLGLFGGGPLSHATLEESGVRAEYERLQRADRQSVITITAPAADAETLLLRVTGDLFAESKIEHISPRPLREQAVEGGVAYTFTVAPGEASRVILRLTPTHAGALRGVLTVGGASLSLSVVVYP